YDVIEVIAIDTVFISDLSTAGCSIVTSLSNSDLSNPKPWLPSGAVIALLNSFFMSDNEIKSCGRLGPERFGSNSERLISNVSVYSRSEERRVGKEDRCQKLQQY